MLTIEEIRKKKEEYHITNAQLADLSGVPFATVQKVLGNVTKSPRLDTMKALSKVFEEKEAAYKGSYETEEGISLVSEPEAAYAIPRFPMNPALKWNTHFYDRQGTYTIDDYLALPDEQRVELIDGVFYDMAGPNTYHQLIGGAIYVEIYNFIKKNKGPSIPFVAPCDVQLDCDNRTMVQPDVMIVCDRDKIKKRLFGAPDFVCEVLSPSTKNKDIIIKTAKYQQAGVKEYWMVDPMEKTVFVYDFREEIKMHLYSFDDTIPVLIFDEKLKIDMKEIREDLSFME